ncbi:hypothetical protein PENTCL1PPCAC_5729, partial [Pristionchus entomophagus]
LELALIRAANSGDAAILSVDWTAMMCTTYPASLNAVLLLLAQILDFNLGNPCKFIQLGRDNFYTWMGLPITSLPDSIQFLSNCRCA